jgi:phage shock protein PspC (stress-responsive transcriptional regulator)
MRCSRCGSELSEGWRYCAACGAPQVPEARPRLMRSATERKLAGVCGGIAEYLGVDPAIVRLVWVVLTILPGALVGGLLAYLAAWLLMPAPGAQPRQPSGRRLYRSATDYRVAGVCGGLAEYFGVDATAVRVLWAILTIFPGMIVLGVLAYLLAWFIMPAAPAVSTPPAVAPTTTTT